jgi:hypothetical protein
MASQRYNTPSSAPDGVVVIALNVPGGEEWESVVRGVLLQLIETENWHQETPGALTPEETVEYFLSPVLDTVSEWQPC